MARSRANITSFTFGFFALALVCALPPVSASNPPVVLDASAPAAAKQLERLYRVIRPAFWQNAATMPTSPAGTGNTYELTADVEGRVGCGGPDMLLLKINGASIDAVIPSSFDPDWLTSGAPIRLIVADNLSSDSATSAGYKILAVAPEAEVVAIEGPNGPSHRSAPNYSRVHLASAVTETRYRTFAPPTDLPPGHPICELSPRAMSVYPYYRAAVLRFNRRLDDLTADKITSSVLAYSDYYHIDPRLIMAMIVAESGFDPNSISVDGAIGVGQLMPGTAAGLGVNPYDPVQNVGAAVKILSTRVNEYGGEDGRGIVPLNTLLLTMAAYNAGDGAVHAYHGVPPYRETQNYVRKVAALYRQMCGG